MRTVWKFLLRETSDPQFLSIPEGAEILLVHGQTNRIGIWAEVDVQASRAPRWFIILPTGEQIPENGEYLGTAFVGPYVFHVYELEGQE